MKLALNYELKALLLLKSLPENLKTLVVSVSNYTPQGKTIMDITKNTACRNEEAKGEIIVRLPVQRRMLLKYKVMEEINAKLNSLKPGGVLSLLIKRYPSDRLRHNKVEC